MYTAMNFASSTPQIPHDLICEILGHLEGDNRPLRTVALSSTILRHEAQTVIFRSVTTLRTERRHLKFLQIVAASPSRLALLVRAYRVATVNMSGELFPRLHGALLAMCNLKHLDVHYMGRIDVKGLDSPATVLRGCTFKLDTFRWITNYSEASELVETFLHQQDRLRHISLRCNHAPALENVQPIDPTISLCPQLVSLTADWDGIKTLLPGHKITALTIFTRPLRKIDINSLAPALKYIKTLSYPFYSVHEEEPQPECFLLHCTSLAVLELRILDDAENFAVLPRIPTLHTLVLSRDLLAKPPLSREQATKFVRRVFDNSSKNLENIHFQIKYEIYEWYMRSRGDDDPIPTISRSEVRAMFPE